VRSLLVSAGFEVRESARAAEALPGLMADPPDLLALDLVMPGMNGFEVLETLRSDARTSALPVLLVTSKVLSPPEREAALRLRATVLPKHALGAPDAAAELERALAQAGWSPPASSARAGRAVEHGR